MKDKLKNFLRMAGGTFATLRMAGGTPAPLPLLMVAVGLLAFVPAARAQFTTRYQFFTNTSYPYPLVMTNGQTIAFGGTNYLPVYRDRGLGLGILFAGTNGTAGAITNLEADFSVYDGVNWYSNNAQLVWLPRAQGNAATATFTNLQKAVLDNVRRIRLETLRWPLLSAGGTGMNTNTIVITNMIGSAYP